MAKKKFYDQHGNEIRSRPSKPFYKKWWFTVAVVLVVILGTVVMYNLSNDEEIVDEPIEREKGEEVKKVEETVMEDPEFAESEEEIVEKQTYKYEDFKGTYVIFEGEPYNSPIESDIMVLGNDFYQTFNRWNFDMNSTILDKTIDGNVLTLNLDSDENQMWGLHSESGTEQFELRYDGDKNSLFNFGRILILFYVQTGSTNPL